MQKQIEEILRRLVAGVDVGSTALVDEGYVTSITMVQLIPALDDAFGVEIDYSAITRENFQSVAAMVQMVSQAGGK